MRACTGSGPPAVQCHTYLRNGLNGDEVREPVSQPDSSADGPSTSDHNGRIHLPFYLAMCMDPTTAIAVARQRCSMMLVSCGHCEPSTKSLLRMRAMLVLYKDALMLLSQHLIPCACLEHACACTHSLCHQQG